jgi:pimeloyl-ACP methyl ester carboxylesterase
VWFFNPNKVTDDYAAEALRPLCIKGSQESMLYVLRNVLQEPFVAREAQELAKRNLNILIIHGRQDQAIPLNRSQALNKLWAGSKLVVFDRTGHSPSEEFPEKFNAIALDFLLEKN